MFEEKLETYFEERVDKDLDAIIETFIGCLSLVK